MLSWGTARNNGTWPAIVCLALVASTQASCSSRRSRTSELPPSPAVPSQPHAGDQLRIENLELGSFGIIALGPIQLAAVAQIEQEGPDGTWLPVQPLDGGTGFKLTNQCARAEPACLSLQAGDVLVPRPWTGFECAAQCGETCPGDRYHSGRHRLTVTTCRDPAFVVKGSPFVFPSEPAMLPRWRATTDVVSALAARVEYNFDERPDSLDHSFRRSGPEYALEAAVVSELVQLIRAADGFVDGRVRRCRPRPAPVLAFYLTLRDVPGINAGSARRSTLVLDLKCSALLVPGIGDEPIAQTHIDPYYTKFRDIARRALPGDSELAKIE